jgi:hypothetical protein
MKILDKDDNKEFNYIDMKNKEFIFNKYKTSKTKDFGQQKIKISDELYNVIKLYNKFRSKDSDFLLLNYEGKELNKINDITKILNSIFKPKLVSSSLLRHIYLSSKYGSVLKEMKEDANIMAHSIDMQKDYIKN